ncbi:hypothetical protein Tco_0683545 [Tanacetum coccineum]
MKCNHNHNVFHKTLNPNSQFKIPNAKETVKPKRKQKGKRGNNSCRLGPEGDENEDRYGTRRLISVGMTKMNLASRARIRALEAGQQYIGKRTPRDWNLLEQALMHGDCQGFKRYTNKVKSYKSGEGNEADLIETVEVAKPIDGDNLQDVFGPDKRERPAGKQRAGKKQKSAETSRSTGGSQSEYVSSLVSQDYRRKCDAAERAYKAQREKDLAIKKCEEMRFLMIDTSNLPPHKRAFIERQQAEIMIKYQDAGADD